MNLLGRALLSLSRKLSNWLLVLSMKFPDWRQDGLLSKESSLEPVNEQVGI